MLGRLQGAFDLRVGCRPGSRVIGILRQRPVCLHFGDLREAKRKRTVFGERVGWSGDKHIAAATPHQLSMKSHLDPFHPGAKSEDKECREYPCTPDGDIRDTHRLPYPPMELLRAEPRWAQCGDTD